MLSTQAYHLARLLMASTCDELLPDQRPCLESRADALWDQIQLAVEHRCQVSAATALVLTEQLIGRLLREECCRRSLRQAVSLREALGPAFVLT